MHIEAAIHFGEHRDARIHDPQTGASWVRMVHDIQLDEPVYGWVRIKGERYEVIPLPDTREHVEWSIRRKIIDEEE